ncbi:MAG TPA: ABC transporter substrate-binding protein [Marmoricola sp.]
MRHSPALHRIVRFVGLTAAVIGLGATTAACGSSSGGTAHGIKLVHAGQLTACTHLPYKPFEFTQNGKVVGFEKDMTDLLAKKLGVTTNVVSLEWTQITSGAAFAAGKCDLGMGAATITPERAKAVKFSAPYFDANQALLVKKGAPYHSLADLRGKTLGVQTDTTGQIYGDKYANKYGYKTVVFDDSVSEFNGVLAGKVAAAINDNGPLLNFTKENPGTTVSAQFPTGEKYGFMVKKNDPNATKLVDKLNAVITQSRKDGTYDRLYKKWFGNMPQKSMG